MGVSSFVNSLHYDSKSKEVSKYGENAILNSYENQFAKLIGETPRLKYRPKECSTSRGACTGDVNGIWKVFKIGGK